MRWHSGHGVTRQSASASTASPRWRPACLSEASLFIVMIGKPQHLCEPAYSMTVPPSASMTCAEVGVARVLVVDAQAVDRAHDVAAVEGADLEVGQRALDARAQLVEADLLDQQPQEVLVGRCPSRSSGRTRRQRLVDVRAVLGVGVEALLALALRALAGRADVHHQLGALDLLGQRERAGVQRVGQLLVVLGDDAGAACSTRGRARRARCRAAARPSPSSRAARG